MQRLKTRAQFEAVLAGGTTVSRTEHFALHRCGLALAPGQDSSSTGPGSGRTQALLFADRGQPWIGAVVPKRWARRAVTRNAIRRQIYTVSQDFEAELPAAAHVVRLRSGFDKAAFPSATSVALKGAVRAELQRLFGGARGDRAGRAGGRASSGPDTSLGRGAATHSAIPAQAGIQSGSGSTSGLDSRLRGTGGDGTGQATAS